MLYLVFAYIFSHLGYIAVTLTLALIVSAVVVRLVRDRKTGKGGCGCGCNGGCNNDGCGCGCGDAAMGAPVAVNVTLGLFSIVKLYRTVNMMVNSLGRCLPESCTAVGSAGDPCADFENIRFPMDMFSPSAAPKSCCGFGPVFGSSNCVISNVAGATDCNGCGTCNGGSCGTCNSCGNNSTNGCNTCGR